MTYQFGQQEQRKILDLYLPIWQDNVLSEAEIREIIEIGERASPQPALIGTNGGTLDNFTRRTDVSWIPPEIAPPWFASRLKDVFEAANKANFNFALTGAEPAQYTKYDGSVGGEYKWHADIMANEHGARKLSMSLLLSDPSEYEGGTLILAPHGTPTTVTQRKGRAIFFPSFAPHCVTPVTAGIRRSLVVWSHGPAFK